MGHLRAPAWRRQALAGTTCPSKSNSGVILPLRVSPHNPPAHQSCQFAKHTCIHNRCSVLRSADQICRWGSHEYEAAIRWQQQFPGGACGRTTDTHESSRSHSQEHRAVDNRKVYSKCQRGLKPSLKRDDLWAHLPHSTCANLFNSIRASPRECRMAITVVLP
jgi:predicted O-linked N-acetylglucosamine transferase (SPINDLY family)